MHFQSFSHGFVDLDQISELITQRLVAVLELNDLRHQLIHFLLLGHDFFKETLLLIIQAFAIRINFAESLLKLRNLSFVHRL